MTKPKFYDVVDIVHYEVFSLAVLKMIFNVVLGPPSPGGSRGRVRTATFLRKSEGFGPFPARIRGAIVFLIFILALSTVGS